MIMGFGGVALARGWRIDPIKTYGTARASDRS